MSVALFVLCSHPWFTVCWRCDLSLAIWLFHSNLKKQWSQEEVSTYCYETIKQYVTLLTIWQIKLFKKATNALFPASRSFSMLLLSSFSFNLIIASLFLCYKPLWPCIHGVCTKQNWYSNPPTYLWPNLVLHTRLKTQRACMHARTYTRTHQ